MNNLSVAVSLLHVDEQSHRSVLAVVNPGESYNIPVPVLYDNGSLFIKPEVTGIDVSAQPLELSKAVSAQPFSQLVSCPNPSEHCDFNIMINASIEKVYTESTNDIKSKCVTLMLTPPVTVINQLPYPIQYTPKGKPSHTLQPGESQPVHTCDSGNQLGAVTLCDYLESSWTYDGTIAKADGPALFSWTFTEDSSSHKSMKLHVMRKDDHGSTLLTIFSPYWFINRTGLKLSYKDPSVKDQMIIPHEATNTKPFMFSFSKLVSNKEKASMMVESSKWSDKFSLDTVGSSGSIICKGDTINYEVGIRISLATNSLTKIVECSPYYVAVNKSSRAVVFTEETDGGSTLIVAPSECEPFWPRLNGKTRKMRIGYSDTTGYPISSKSFSFNETHSTLLKFHTDEANTTQYAALNVEVTVSELAVVITVDDYKTGQEAARLVNCMSDMLVTYHQEKHEEVICLGPGESALFTWQDPLLKRMLVWSAGMEADKSDDLMKDGIGEFYADKGSNHKLFWVSFLDGMQRVLLFTEDFLQATRAQEAGEFERINFDIELSMEGAGVSMVDNDLRREIAYLGITSSGVVWEEKRKRRWRALNHQACDVLEEQAVKFHAVQSVGKSTSPIVTTDKLEADVQNMRMLKPNKRAIRRAFQPGIWMEYKTSLHQTHLHAKINRIQFDDQLPDAVYPVVFSPTPLPKSVAAESIPKPFIEASLVMRKHEHSNVQQIKYLKVLVQEMSVKADQGFINALMPFFGTGERTPEQISKDFESDLERVKDTLQQFSSSSAQQGNKNFYDMLHISPLKIHLSFSVTGGKSDGKAAIKSEALQLFLQSVGVAITDIQDVVFRIAYFERKFVFYNEAVLVEQIRKHYTQQAIKQAYVLVLGLDVIGNPFGLVQGLAGGAKDLFYEPIQGAIQGPEEFAEGLAIGLRSLLSGTLGGAAGAVSRITGTFGKGLAALTFDDKYQKQRREKLTREPTTATEGIARGVKGLGMGFFDGVTGIIRKPVEGAKQEGVEGFFKGVGKGLIGVVARPVGGIVDLTSSSLEGIRKATTISQEVTRMRPPRVIRADGVITPYNYRQAAGSNILTQVNQGKFATTDVFVAHCAVTGDNRNILLATDRRVMFVVRGEMLGQWNMDWSYDWNVLTEAPSVVENYKIKFLAKSEDKKSFSLFGGKKSQGKLVPLGDPKEAEWMVRKMLEAYHRAKKGAQ